VLPIAPSTYYEHRARQRDSAHRPARMQRDERLRMQIRRVYDDSFDGVYGAKKVSRQLHREDVAVARCTVERLMRGMGLRGAVRGRAFKVTIVADNAAVRPPDLVAREFQASRPNQLWVADLTYMATLGGLRLRRLRHRRVLTLAKRYPRPRAVRTVLCDAPESSTARRASRTALGSDVGPTV
jgi:putative transposase